MIAQTMCPKCRQPCLVAEIWAYRVCCENCYVSNVRSKAHTPRREPFKVKVGRKFAGKA